MVKKTQITDEQARAMVSELQLVFHELYQGRRCSLQYVIAMLTGTQERWLKRYGISAISDEERIAAILEALMQEQAVVS